MRSAKGPRAAVLLLGLAVGATAFQLGCAMDPNFMPVLTQPAPQRRGADPGRLAYEAGYQAGRRDDQRELRADYSRHQSAYDWSSERAFAAGYRDGYAGNSDQYATSTSRGWSGSDDDDEDGDRGRVVSAVPSWLVGDFQGWNDAYDTDVALRVAPNASVVLVAGGRERQGVYRSGQVHFRNSAYSITRLRDGIRFTRVDDARNTVVLRRVD